MTRATPVRPAVSGLVLSILLLVASMSAGLAAEPSEDPSVVGRWTAVSVAGGAVWAFQPSGVLVVTGPGEITSEGTWTTGLGEREFDATVEVPVTGQALTVMGEVARDGLGIALYVAATDASKPDDWTPWPPESRLVGERFGMTVEETPQPTPPPLDCLRPEWIEGVVDWDRCDDETPAA